MVMDHEQANVSPKECPNCKLLNAPEAQRCDCGYDFMEHVILKSYSGGGGQKNHKGPYIVWSALSAVLGLVAGAASLVIVDTYFFDFAAKFTSHVIPICIGVSFIVLTVGLATGFLLIRPSEGSLINIVAWTLFIFMVADFVVLTVLGFMLSI